MEVKKEIIVNYKGYLLFAPVYMADLNTEDQEVYTDKGFGWVLNVALFCQQLINVFLYQIAPNAVGFPFRVKKLSKPKKIYV